MNKLMLDFSSSIITEIIIHLKLWCEGIPRPESAQKLLRLAVQIALGSYALRRKLQTASIKAETSNDTMATSVVAVLFRENGPNSALARGLSELFSEGDAVVFRTFESIIMTVASQELFHRWNESDPDSARLHRSLMRILNTDQRLTVFPPGRRQWVALCGLNDLREGELPWNEDELLSILLRNNSVQKSLGDHIYSLLTHLSESQNKWAAIEISVLFSALIKFRKWEKEQEQSAVLGELTSVNPHLALMAQRASKRIVLEANQRLSRNHQGSHNRLKFNNIYLKAISDLISDIKTGQELAGHIDYLGF